MSENPHCIYWGCGRRVVCEGCEGDGGSEGGEFVRAAEGTRAESIRGCGGSEGGEFSRAMEGVRVGSIRGRWRE